MELGDRRSKATFNVVRPISKNTLIDINDNDGYITGMSLCKGNVTFLQSGSDSIHSTRPFDKLPTVGALYCQEREQHYKNNNNESELNNRMKLKKPNKLQLIAEACAKY